jgi:hypothetical protein
MPERAPTEIVLLVACFLYYGAKWEYSFVIRKLESGHAYFYGYLVSIALTAILQSVYITQVDDSWTNYIVSYTLSTDYRVSIAHTYPPPPGSGTLVRHGIASSGFPVQ